MPTQLTLVATFGIQEKVTVGWQSIASCSPYFLHIALEVPRHIIVDHRPYVRLIDAHAEGDGGHNYTQLVAHESLLDGAAPGSGHSGMVRLCLPVHPLAFLSRILGWLPTILHTCSNETSDSLALVSPCAVDNDGLARLKAEIIENS